MLRWSAVHNLPQRRCATFDVGHQGLAHDMSAYAVLSLLMPPPALECEGVTLSAATLEMHSAVIRELIMR